MLTKIKGLFQPKKRYLTNAQALARLNDDQTAYYGSLLLGYVAETLRKKSYNKFDVGLIAKDTHDSLPNSILPNVSEKLRWEVIYQYAIAYQALAELMRVQDG